MRYHVEDAYGWCFILRVINIFEIRKKKNLKSNEIDRNKVSI